MNNLAISFAIGLAAGIGTLLIATMVFIPISYVMNRFIYHHWIMRIILGFVALVLFPFFFVGMIFMAFGGLLPTYYFGLIPAYLQADTPGEPVGFFAIFFKILAMICHPFVGFMNLEEDVVGYKNNLKPLMAPEGTPVVNEVLFKEAAVAGALKEEIPWNDETNRLKPLFQEMFAARDPAAASR